MEKNELKNNSAAGGATTGVGGVELLLDKLLAEIGAQAKVCSGKCFKKALCVLFCSNVYLANLLGGSIALHDSSPSIVPTINSFFCLNNGKDVGAADVSNIHVLIFCASAF